MSEKTRHPLARAAKFAGWILLGFFGLLVLAPWFVPLGIEVVFRLAGGFAFFLSDRLRLISIDAGTLVPGLVAFALGLAVMHRLMSAWTANRAKPWTIGSTVCLGSMLPILFAISFLVPGVLLQIHGLAKDPMIARDQRGERSMISSELNWIMLTLFDASSADPREEFPRDLSQLGENYRESLERLDRITREPGRPAEPLIYLGAELSARSDPDLPLIISPPYLRRGKLCRFVGKVDSSVVEIPAEDVDAWIDKAMAARRR